MILQKKLFKTFLLLVASTTILESCGSRTPPVSENKEDSFLTKLDRSKGFQGISLGNNAKALTSRIIEDHKLNESESVYSFLPTQRLAQPCNNDMTITATTYHDRIVKIEIAIYCPDYNEVLGIFKQEYGDPDDIDTKKAIWESSNTYLALTKISDSTTTAVYKDKVVPEIMDTTQIQR